LFGIGGIYPSALAVVVFIPCEDRIAADACEVTVELELTAVGDFGEFGGDFVIAFLAEIFHDIVESVCRFAG